MNRFIDINPERCIGCGTCQSACADAHRMQGLQDTPRLALVKTGGISAALACHHCEGAPCAEVCPVNAIEHDGDRIHVKEQECIGCRLCAIACPSVPSIPMARLSPVSQACATRRLRILSP